MVVQIRNRRIQPVPSSQVAAVLLRNLYASPRLLFLLSRIEAKEFFTNEALKLSARSVKLIASEETLLKRRCVTLRTVGGKELFIETLNEFSTYRGVHALARRALNLKLRASPFSMRLQYLSSHMPDSCPRYFRLHDVLPCHDLRCYKALRGTEWQVLVYRPS